MWNSRKPVYTTFMVKGVYANPIISPAVPPNRCLIRTSYMTIHTDEELDQILEIAAEEGRRLQIIWRSQRMNSGFFINV